MPARPPETRRGGTAWGNAPVAPPLCGRKHELGVIGHAISTLAAGGGSVVVVEGVTGTGKTRLLSEAASRARQAGVNVAAGRGEELSRLAPSGLLLTALTGCDPQVLDRSPLDNLSFPERRLQLVQRLRCALRDRLVQGQLLIVLDDLQWADPVTLLALRMLVSELTGEPVTWLLARNRVPESRGLACLVQALRNVGAVSLKLVGLAPDEVAELAAEILGAPPDIPLLRLVQQAGGIPLLLVDLLRLLRDEGAALVESGQARLTCRGVGQAFGGLPVRLGPASDSTRQMLEVASLFGDSFDADAVAAMLQRPVAVLLADIEEALRAGILEEDGPHLAFQHPVVRHALYNAIPVPLRRALHREAAAVRPGRGIDVDVPMAPRKSADRSALGWDSLTAAELRTARLVARGLTNRGIADEELLSHHTVDSHLKHVFTKLGIRSRVELTRLVLTHERSG